jgi:hypothetical protein
VCVSERFVEGTDAVHRRDCVSLFLPSNHMFPINAARPSDTLSDFKKFGYDSKLNKVDSSEAER